MTASGSQMDQFSFNMLIFPQLQSLREVVHAGWENYSMLSLLWQEPLAIDQTSKKNSLKTSKTQLTALSDISCYISTIFD